MILSAPVCPSLVLELVARMLFERAGDRAGVIRGRHQGLLQLVLAGRSKGFAGSLRTVLGFSSVWLLALLVCFISASRISNNSDEALG